MAPIMTARARPHVYSSPRAREAGADAMFPDEGAEAQRGQAPRRAPVPGRRPRTHVLSRFLPAGIALAGRHVLWDFENQDGNYQKPGPPFHPPVPLHPPCPAWPGKSPLWPNGSVETEAVADGRGHA